jgi:hypothetical protein
VNESQGSLKKNFEDLLIKYTKLLEIKEATDRRVEDVKLAQEELENIQGALDSDQNRILKAREGFLVKVSY